MNKIDETEREYLLQERIAIMQESGVQDAERKAEQDVQRVIEQEERANRGQ